MRAIYKYPRVKQCTCTRWHPLFHKQRRGERGRRVCVLHSGRGAARVCVCPFSVSYRRHVRACCGAQADKMHMWLCSSHQGEHTCTTYRTLYIAHIADSHHSYCERPVPRLLHTIKESTHARHITHCIWHIADSHHSY